MQPLFAGNESRQRRINLGGNSAVASHQELLKQAREVRNERQLARRRQEATVRLQAAWRGELSRRAAKELLRKSFDENPVGINAMRCLVLLGNDEERLGKWSESITSMDEVSLLGLARGSDRESWLVLIRQISVKLLESVAKNPQSKSAPSHLKVIAMLLSPTIIDRVLPSAGHPVSEDITKYLLRHDYYLLLKRATEQIPLSTSKKSPTLPFLVTLFTAPLLLFTEGGEMYLACFKEIIQYILPISLLPNRLPLTSLTQLSTQLPLQSFGLLVPMLDDIISSLDIEQKVNLVANLAAFMPPRYVRLSAATLDAYLDFLSKLLFDFPEAAFQTPMDTSSRQTSWNQDSSSSDDEDDKMGQLSTYYPKLEVDTRTRSRLQTLATQNHIASLITASASNVQARLSLYKFIMALYGAWPSCRSKLLTSVIASGGAGLVRELYRGYVRSSPLGKNDSLSALTDSGSENTRSWLPLLFLADLYAQMLLTMGDDEFFASRSGGATVPQAQRNPLTVDEVISFSRQLMNIAFVLIWHMSMDETDGSYFKGKVPGTALGWEVVRDKVTALVQAIHDRDSRRPFTPSGHWLASQLDLASFSNIAVAEEQKLSEEGSSAPPRARSVLSKRKLAQISPRLNVLHQIPFAIPFETRVHIFRQFVVGDMTKSQNGMSRFDLAYDGRMRQKATVRRGHVAADGFDKLSTANLKGHIEITFIDKFGQEEAGIDGGGVFKEFFTELCKEVFDTDRGLWLATQKNELYPNPHSYAKESHSLDWYRFIGRILGKALYEGILVDVAFAGFFLAKWLGKQSFLDDLASLSPELYNGLLFLKNYTGNPEDLSLTFAVEEEDFGVTRTVNLIPNGTDIPVTKDNRLQYIFLMCHYRLTKQIRPQSEAFFQGLSEMIDPKWIRMFNQQELQILIGGVNSPIDLNDLRAHTNYGGLYNDNDETITAFWRVVNSFDHDQRRALLRFATSCSRPPLLGFKELTPNFSIRDAGTDQNRLPTASTCVNLLKLPRYTNERTLRNKLLQAITAGAGFDLS